MFLVAKSNLKKNTKYGFGESYLVSVAVLGKMEKVSVVMSYNCKEM